MSIPIPPKLRKLLCNVPVLDCVCFRCGGGQSQTFSQSTTAYRMTRIVRTLTGNFTVLGDPSPR